MKRRGPLDIAIVGMACRFPGAPDLFTFWENILAGRDCTRDVPPDRWDPATFFEPDSSSNDRLSCRRGGYLDPHLNFDPVAHGIMPLCVEGGEPEQFLILDTTLAALQDAELDPNQLDRGRVEVVVGRGNYFNRGNLTRLQHGRIIAQTVQILAALHPEWTPEDLDAIRLDLKSSLPPFESATIPGQLTNATAGRVAQRLGLTGASYVVDAASASSLVAVELGARALWEQRSDLALVGGVYLEADVDFPLVFRQLDALSRSGTSRPFSADADGMLPGEGVGVVVLKRLADAERDGDRIYATLKGIGIASDGRGPGLVAPSARGHVRAMRRAYRNARIDPATVALIEGHGLGVPAADRAEIRALRAVFPPLARGRRVLGAVSSNIGHAMPAAGMAGLIKSALALFQRTFPATLQGERPHPLLERSDSPFALNQKARPWLHIDNALPRRAGVNAFGFAGINSHAILEEHAPSADGLTSGALPRWDQEAILVSAPSRAELLDRVRWLQEWLRFEPDVTLKDLAFTLNADAAKAPGRVRIGLVVGSFQDLAERLESVGDRLSRPDCPSIRDARGAYFWNEPLALDHTGKLAFLFPGEGSQYPGMLADLCHHFPEIRNQIETSDRIACAHGETVPPSEHLFGDDQEDQTYQSVGLAVNLVLSSQWGIYQILKRLNIQANAVLGHSSGELLALAAAEVLEADTTLGHQLGQLGSVIRVQENSGAVPEARLVAVATDRDRARSTIEALKAEVTVAIDNCPHQVILAGPFQAVELVVARLRSEGIPTEDLPFTRAYHTPSFNTVLEPIAQFYQALRLQSPRLPIYSCSIADRMPSNPEAVRRLAVDQWTRPVAFRDTIEAMYRDGYRLFVEVGARGHLAGAVEDTLRGRPSFAVAANLPRRSGTLQLCHLVASLFAHGVDLDPSFLYARRRPRRIDLQTPISTPRNPARLMIGFPELRLSQFLINRLRTQAHAHDNAGSSVSPAPSRPTPVAANGHSDHSHQISTAPHHGTRATHQQEVPNLQSMMPLPNPVGINGVDQTEVDAGMLAYFETMRSFLDTQHEVMAQFLGHEAEPEQEESGWDELAHLERSPGPWAGTIVERTSEHVITVLTLDAQADPIAEHHTLGGRRVSALDPNRKGLPVLPFAVMAEMVAQVAVLLVPPGLVLTALSEVRARKWVRYETNPSPLELRARRVVGEAGAVRVEIVNRSSNAPATAKPDAPVFEGTAVFGSEPADAPMSPPFPLPESQASRYTAASLYEEQWLFHGPAMQALAQVGPVSRVGIEGMIKVLPHEPLFQAGACSGLLTDPIVLDTFTHLLGCWGLDYLVEGGEVIYPLRMGALTLFGEAPPVGSLVDCRIFIRDLERYRVRVDAEIVRPDGRLWMRIEGWEDWRFHWPSRYRDVFRQPDSVFVGEELAMADVPADQVRAVWLKPPADMGRPIWRDVLEHIQLGPRERAELLAKTKTNAQRSQRLWGRIAAKEAARRLWLDREGRTVYPADLAILHDEHGKPRLRLLAEPTRDDLPAISIAHTDGVAVALAAVDPSARLGIDVEPIVERSSEFESLALLERERSMLQRWSGADRWEWIARFWCAKEAAAKATGLGMREGPRGLEVHAVDARTGRLLVRIGPALASACPEWEGQPIRVSTLKRDTHVWAWTVGEPDES